MVKKRLVLLILLFLSGSFRLAAQETKEQFVIVTIEKKSSSSMHPFTTDYWVVSRRLWSQNADKPALPLFLTGFSATDYTECCVDKSLILFNITTAESFDYKAGFIEDNNQFIKMVLEKRRRIQTIRKQWLSGKKEKINVYITPINGDFCICTLRHDKNDANLGYTGQAAIPVADFTFDVDFWGSKEWKGIIQFDYSELPFMSLQNIQ